MLPYTDRLLRAPVTGIRHDKATSTLYIEIQKGFDGSTIFSQAEYPLFCHFRNMPSALVCD